MKSDSNVLLHHKYSSSIAFDNRCRRLEYCLHRIPRPVVNSAYIVHPGDFLCTDHFGGILVSPLLPCRPRKNSPV